MLNYKVKFAYVNGKQYEYRVINKPVIEPYFVIQKQHIYLITSKKHETQVIKDFVPIHIKYYYDLSGKKDHNAPVNNEISKVKILGNSYQVKQVKLKGTKKYEIIGNTIYINDKFNKTYIIKDIYIDIVTPYVQKRTKYWQIKMGLNKHNIQIELPWLKRYLGVCCQETNGVRKIQFAARLLSYDKPQIDCTIVHELAHIVHFNHKKPFWDLVVKYIPNYWKLHHTMVW